MENREERDVWYISIEEERDTRTSIKKKKNKKGIETRKKQLKQILFS